MNYQTVYVKNHDAAKNYVADVIDGQDGYKVHRTVHSYIITCGDVTVMIIVVDATNKTAINY